MLSWQRNNRHGCPVAVFGILTVKMMVKVLNRIDDKSDS